MERLLTWAARAIGALIVIAVAGLAAFELFLDDAFYRWAGLRAVREATGWSVVAGEVTASHGRVLTLVARDVKAESRAVDKPRRTAAIGEFQAEIRLWPLLHGVVHVEDALVRNADIELGTLDLVRRNEPPPSPAGLPIVEQMRLQNVRVRFATPAESHHLQIDELVLDEADDSGVDVRGAGLLDGRRASLEGWLGGVDVLLAEGNPYPVQLSLDAPLLGLGGRLSGTIERPLRGTGLDVQVDVSIGDLAALRDTFGIAMPLHGEVTLSTRLTGAVNAPAVDELDLRVDDGTRLQIRVRGAMQRPAALGGASLHIDASSSDVAYLQELGLPQLPPSIGKVELQASVDGDAGSYLLRRLELHAGGTGGLAANVTGSVELRALDAPWPIDKLSLSGDLSAPGTGDLAIWLPADTPQLGPLRVSGQVSLDGAKMSVKDLAVDVGEGADALQLRAVGDLTTVLPEKQGEAMPWRRVPRAVALALAANVEDPARAGARIGQALPDVGPVTASAKLTGEGGKLALEDVHVEAGRERPLQLAARGRVVLADTLGGPHYWRDADLALQASGPDAAALAPLGVKPGLPLPAWKAEGALRGGPDKAVIENLRVTVGAEGSALTFEGGVEGVQRILESGARGLRIEGRVGAASTAALSPLLGREVPALGPIEGEVTLRGAEEGWSLVASTFRSHNDDGVELEARASAVRVPADLEGSLDGLEVGAQVHSPSAAALGKWLGVDLPALGPVTLSGRASGEGRAVNLHELRAAAGEPNGLALTGDGRVDPFADPPAYALTVEGTAANPAALAGKADDPGVLHPASLKLAGEVEGAGRESRFKGTLGFGETRFDVDAGVHAGDARPRYQARLHTPLARMEDLGLEGEAFARLLRHIAPTSVPTVVHPAEGQTAAEKPVAEKPAPDQPASPPAADAATRVFGDQPLPFDVLRTFDLDLDLSAARVVGKRIQIDAFRTAATLEDGRLRVDPVKFSFEGGSVATQLEADAGTDPPSVAIRSDVTDMSVGALHAQITDAPSVMEGSLNVAVRVHGRGRSPHDIVTTLDGQTDVVLENAKLPGHDLDLLLVDTLSWLITSVVSDDKTQVNCAIGRFEFHDGIATAKAIVVDTPDMLAGGVGVIDLRTEQIDLRIKPQRKIPGLGPTTTVQVRGHLASPEFDSSGTVVNVAGQALTLINPIAFLSVRGFGLLGGAVQEDPDSPCLVARRAADKAESTAGARPGAPPASGSAAPTAAEPGESGAPPAAEAAPEKKGFLRRFLPF